MPSYIGTATMCLWRDCVIMMRPQGQDETCASDKLDASISHAPKGWTAPCTLHVLSAAHVSGKCTGGRRGVVDDARREEQPLHALAKRTHRASGGRGL